MGLPWVRLDTQFPSNPKVLQLIEGKKYRAALAWLSSLAYSGAHGTDGYLPATCLPFIHATKADAADLVDIGFWHEVKGGGWEINGWLEFQQSNGETQDRRLKAERAGRKASCVRWHGKDCGCWKRT